MGWVSTDGIEQGARLRDDRGGTNYCSTASAIVMKWAPAILSGISPNHGALGGGRLVRAAHGSSRQSGFEGLSSLWMQPVSRGAPPQFSTDRQWWWDGHQWLSAVSPDGRYRWDGVAWLSTDSAQTATAGPARFVLQPDRATILKMGIRITGMSFTAALVFALGLTFASHLRPVFHFHMSPLVYTIIAFVAIIEGLAIFGLAQAHFRGVSIGLSSDRIVFGNLGQPQRTVALDAALTAEAVLVTFKWLFLVIDLKYIVFLWRGRTCIQALDAAEWPAPALLRLMDQLRMNGVLVSGDWNGPSVRLFGPGPSLASRYPGATRLRSGPYSLQALSVAILIFSCGSLVVLPFVIG